MIHVLYTLYMAPIYLVPLSVRTHIYLYTDTVILDAIHTHKLYTDTVYALH